MKALRGVLPSSPNKGDGIPESEEKLIVEYIYLTYLMNALESDQKTVNRINFKIPEVYQHLIENKIDFLWKKIVKVKKEMKELKIRVEDPRRVNVEFMEYHYFAHGYEGKMRFWDAAMRYEGTRRLKEVFKAPHK